MDQGVKQNLGWLGLLASLIFAVEFAIKYGFKHPLFALAAFFPGLVPYLLLAWAGAGLSRIFAPRSKPLLSGFLFYWLGLAFLLAPMAVLFFLDRFPGAILWSKMGLFLVGLTGGAAFVISLVLALTGLRLSRLESPKPGKVLFRVWACFCLPLGVLIALLAAPLGWLADPLPPRISPQPSAAAAPVNRNVILITIDTLRADFLPVYGAKEVKTPNLDRLLDGGLVFARSRSTASFTLAGHTGLLTGRHPAELGIVSNEARLPKEVPTIARPLSRAGWTTAAILSSASLSPESGIARDFTQRYTPYLEMKGSYTDFLKLSLPRLIAGLFDPVLWSCSNKKTARTALSWLEKQGRRQPFFLFIHFWGVHSAYRPPLQYYWSANRSDPIWARLSDRGRYRGELLDVDFQLGRIFDWLEKNGLWDKTVVVLTADHGEGLWDHGYCKHIWQVYEEQLRVPLIVHPAGASGPTRKIDSLISTAAVPNLILQQLGYLKELPQPEPYIRSISAFARKAAITDGRRKQILVRKTEELKSFDLDKDPDELKDLKLDRQAWPDLTEPLTTWRIQSQEDSTPAASPGRKRGLKALGYM